MEGVKIKSAYRKIVQSGDMIEIYDYEKAPNKERFNKRKKNRTRVRRRLHRNVQRAKDQFRRMVRTSLALGSPAFATLTMVSITSIETSYRYFSRFTTNLRRLYGNDIAWIAVPEFHRKHGRIHYHALIWGLDDETLNTERSTRNLQACWQRGWLDIFRTDGSPKISSYMAKYMQKSMQDDRFFGKKSYTASRNALRPTLLNTGTELAYFEEEWPEVGDNYTGQYELERVYKTEWLGRCHYRKLTVVK